MEVAFLWIRRVLFCAFTVKSEKETVPGVEGAKQRREILKKKKKKKNLMIMADHQQSHDDIFVA